MESKKIAELRKDNEGKLPTYAWPGGYPMYYLDRDSSILCPACANENDGEIFPLVAYDVHWEGEPLICDQCMKSIESAYGMSE